MSIQMEAFKDWGNDFKSFFSFNINGFIDGVENGKAEKKKKKKNLCFGITQNSDSAPWSQNPFLHVNKNVFSLARSYRSVLFMQRK